MSSLQDFTGKTIVIFITLLAVSIFRAPLDCPGQQSPTPQTKKTEKAPSLGSITGIVFDSSGRPASGVKVTLAPLDTSGGGNRFVQKTKTDPAGRFFFEGLPDRAFYVLTNEYSGSTFNEIHVPGDYVTIHVEKSGVITGRVTDA